MELYKTDIFYTLFHGVACVSASNVEFFFLTFFYKPCMDTAWNFFEHRFHLKSIFVQVT